MKKAKNHAASRGAARQRYRLKTYKAMGQNKGDGIK